MRKHILKVEIVIVCWVVTTTLIEAHISIDENQECFLSSKMSLLLRSSHWIYGWRWTIMQHAKMGI